MRKKEEKCQDEKAFIEAKGQDEKAFVEAKGQEQKFAMKKPFRIINYKFGKFIIGVEPILLPTCIF